MKVPLAETSRAQYAGKRLECSVYVTGKGSTPFIIPKLVYFDCSNIKRNCQVCVFAESRSGELLVQASSRNILSLLGKADRTVATQLRAWMGVCDDCHVQVRQTQNVEELRVSPRLDTFLPSAEYVTRECYFLGHGLLPNRPYELECYCYPDPTTQRAVLVAEKATPLRDTIETYTFEPSRLEIFRGHPDFVFLDVYHDFASNVHRIVGRHLLQYAFDLVFHSVLNFKFQGVELRRGWVEGFILGDSGQGKTEMSLCLLNHYGLGDRIQGEGSSTAGLVGGLEKMGDRWILVWGRIPQMDRRLLIIDEFGGLSEEDVAKLSDIRATGIAEITKIRTERASARTRLVMMSNTRDGQPLGAYNTGVEALKGVFGHAEDVRRLDFALCVATSEVSTDLLNAPAPRVPHKYTSEACRDLILWAWSRAPDQVHFAEGVEDSILKRAIELSGKYSAFIPLIEPADTRIKLARLAVSCAARCFSSDEDGDIIVKPEHVDFVCDFLKACYDSPFMSYDVYSERARSEAVFGDGEFELALTELKKLPRYEEAVSVLERIGNPFRMYELSEQIGLDTWEAREIIRFLSRHKMVKTLPAGYQKLTKLNTFLKEVRSGVQG
jgi:hypothetical protein